MSHRDKRPRDSQIENELEDENDHIKKSRFSTIPSHIVINTRDYKKDVESSVNADDWGEDVDDELNHDSVSPEHTKRSGVDREKLALIRLLHKGIDLVDNDDTRLESLELEAEVGLHGSDTHTNSKIAQLEETLDHKIHQLKSTKSSSDTPSPVSTSSIIPDQHHSSQYGQGFNLEIPKTPAAAVSDDPSTVGSGNGGDVDDDGSTTMASTLTTEEYMARRDAFYKQLDREAKQTSESLVKFTDKDSDDDDNDDDDVDGDVDGHGYSDHESDRLKGSIDQPKQLSQDDIAHIIKFSLDLCKRYNASSINMLVSLLHKKRQEVTNAQSALATLLQQTQQAAGTSTSIPSTATSIPSTVTSSAAPEKPIRRKNVRTKPSAFNASQHHHQTQEETARQYKKIIEKWDQDGSQIHLDTIVANVDILISAGYEQASSLSLDELEHAYHNLSKG